MEGFTALIQDYARRRLITGIQITRGAPILSHMFFAEDSLIYCKANEAEAYQINRMLQIYDRTSDQQINKTKSSVLFNCNTIQEERVIVYNTLNFQEAIEWTTYPGLPNLVGRNKMVMFGYLKN